MLDKSYKTINSTHYRQFTEHVLKIHLESIGQELADSPCRYASVIFDGTTWNGEVFGVLVKYWSSKASISIKVLHLCLFLFVNSARQSDFCTLTQR